MSVQRWWYGVIAGILATSGCGRGAEVSDTTVTTAQPTGVEGAWRVVLLKQANNAAVNAPPGVYVFAGNHYSLLYATTSSRAPFVKGDAATDAEKVGAYNSVIANAGTYVINGDTLTIHPIISKNPNFMGGEDKFITSFVADTLRLSSAPGAFRWASGPATTAAVDSIILVRPR